MRIVQLPSTFLPQNTGGKEVFVYYLSQSLRRAEIDNVIILHTVYEKTDFEYNGIPVHILPNPVTLNKRRSYFTKTFNSIGGFQDFLKEYKPDLVHFHDQGEGASLSHLRACKQQNIKTLLTYHSPGQSCMQRALIYAGKKPCDGKIDKIRCTSCRMQMKGIPEYLSNFFAQIKLNSDPSGKMIFRNSTDLFYKTWHEFYESVDAIQIHAGWVKKMLILNNISPEKIYFIQMGGPERIINTNSDRKQDKLKLAFIGRCVDIKGVHLLIEAVKSLKPEINIEVHFFGTSWNDSTYGKKMLSLIQGDSRFKKPLLLNPTEVVKELSELDACVIPSIWPETGPFTVFEALAAGIPVIGANLPAISERIIDHENGLLFKWNDAEDLKNQIKLLWVDNALLKKLKNNIKPGRTYDQFYSEIIALYYKILK